MPYCTNCGEEVTDEQRYCSYCGEPVGDERRRGRRHDREQQTADHGTTEAPAPQEADERVRGEPRGSRTSTVDLYLGSLRGIFGQPLPLLALGVAWFGVSAQILLSPAAAVVVTVLGAGVGLVAAGVLYLTTAGQRRGEETTITEAYVRVFGTALSLVAVWLVYVVTVIVGLALFVLPGLYLGGRLLLAFPACVVDEQGALESLQTSWRCTSNVSLKPIGLLVFGVITSIVLAVVLLIPQAITLGVIGVELPAAESVETIDEALDILDNPRYVVVNSFYQAIALAVPVGAIQIAAARLYLEQRTSGTDPHPRP